MHSSGLQGGERLTKAMIDSNAIMDVSILPDFCICALFYAQTFERNVENGGSEFYTREN